MENYSQRYYIRELYQRNSRKIAILGSGIVSNLAQRFHKDSITLTRKRIDIFLDHVFFHDTVENRLMLLLFGLDFTSKEIPVWYYDTITGEYTDTPTDEIRRQIALEKMGDPTQPVVLSTMTMEQKSFRNLIFNEQKLINQLQIANENIILHPDRIEEFSNYVRCYFDDLYIDFEYIINTIPQPFFSQLVGNDKEFKYSSLIFATKKSEEMDKMIYSYNGCFWKRKFIKNNILCIEFDKKDFNAAEFHHVFKERADSYHINEIPYGRILSEPVEDTPRIKHVGRFAQWDHRITTEHAINKLINLNL